MSVLKPRNRILIFRLTQDEYQDLQSACIAKGARSLSDFARSKLLTSIHGDTHPAALSDGSPLSFEEKLSEMCSAIQQIARLLEKQ